MVEEPRATPDRAKSTSETWPKLGSPLPPQRIERNFLAAHGIETETASTQPLRRIPLR